MELFCLVLLVGSCGWNGCVGQNTDPTTTTTITSLRLACAEKSLFQCNTTDRNGFCTSITSSPALPPLSIDNKTLPYSESRTIKRPRLLEPRSGPLCWSDSSGYSCCSNPCKTNPCWNGGTCRNLTGNQSFECDCPANVDGEWCQIDLRCTACDGVNANCIEGKCVCKTGFRGNGEHCTAECAAKNLTRSEIERVSPGCDHDILSFGASTEDLNQESQQRCDNPNRSAAKIECIKSESGATEFEISSLTCVPCNKTLENIANKEIPKNITAEEVEDDLEELEVLTSATNKTKTQIADTTTYLKTLADALTQTDAEGTPKKVNVTEKSVKKILEIVGNLQTELTDREDQNKRTEPSGDKIEPKVTESEDSKEIRQSIKQTMEIIDTFARNVDLGEEKKVILITKKISLEIQQPQQHYGKHQTVILAPQAYTEVPDKSAEEPVVVKRDVVNITVPADAVQRLNEMARKAGATPLKLVVVLYNDASLLTVDKRTGRVVQVTYKPGEATDSVVAPIGTTFQIEHKEPPEPSKQQEEQVESEEVLLALHKEYFCVFWDFKHHEWANEGCEFINDTVAERTYCECNHFTSFALLLRVTTRLENYAADKPSEIYSLVASALSSVCLIATVLIYLIVKELRIRRPTPIMVNICINLAIAYLMFIVGMDGRARGYSEVGCYISAVIMHIAFLCSWFWMLIYSLNMYFALVRIVGTTPLVSRKPFMYVFGYVVPILYVAIDLIVSVQMDAQPKKIEATDFESKYIASHVCWVRHLSMYLGFVAPVGLILLINIVLFFIIIRKLTWKRKEIQSSKEAVNIKQQISMAVTMITMMGLTWIFGYIMLISEQMTFQTIMSIIFNIFNTAQGIVIFYVSCIRQKAVRNMWLEPIRKRFGCAGHKKPKGAKTLGSESGITVSTGTTTLPRKDTTTTAL